MSCFRHLLLVTFLLPNLSLAMSFHNPSCANLSQAVCSIKSAFSMANEKASLTSQYLSEEILKGDLDTKITAQYRAIQRGFFNAKERMGISDEELENIFNETKNSLIKMVEVDTKLEESLKKRIRSKLERSVFRTPPQYIEAKINELRIYNSESTDLELLVPALNIFQNKCAELGMYVNANTEMKNGIYNVLICSGSFHGMADYGKSKREIMNSIAFAMGHELGHVIFFEGLGTSSFSSMSNCLQNAPLNIPGQHAGEIIPDYWAARILSERTANLQETVASLAMSFGPHCTTPVDPTHPSVSTRIELISRYPFIRERMECDTEIESKPYCNLDRAL